MRLGSVLAGVALALSSAAAAETYPTLKGEGQIRVQNDWRYRAGGGGEKLNDTFTKSELSVELGLMEGLSIVSQIKLEPVKSADGDRFFGDQGLWLEQLHVAWETDRYKLFAGKFNPRFGFGFEKAPYIYGRDFVEDYETTEAIGFGGALKHESEAWGEHALTGSVYFKDSTPLSQSAFSRPRFDDPRTERPGRLRKRDGGVANTRSLESFALTLEGGKPAAAPGLEYTIGWRRQRQGETEGADESAFVVGLAYKMEVMEGLSVTPMAEFAHVDRLDGGDARGRYLTGAVTAEHGPWSLGISYTDRRIRFAGQGTDDDRLFQVTAGYTFEFGLGLYLGWKTQRVAGATSDSLGAMALYRFAF